MKWRPRCKLEGIIKMGLKDTGWARNGFVWFKTVTEDLLVCEENLCSVESVSFSSKSTVANTHHSYLRCNSHNKQYR